MHIFQFKQSEGKKPFLTGILHRRAWCVMNETKMEAEAEAFHVNYKFTTAFSLFSFSNYKENVENKHFQNWASFKTFLKI